MYCKNCGNPMNDLAVVCVKCGAAKGTGAGFCPNCGAAATAGASICTRCGIALAPMAAAPAGEQKSKIAAGLLGIFLGSLGIHNFYLGYTSRALIQLLVTLLAPIATALLTCGLGAPLGLLAAAGMGVWGLVEGILILTGSINQDAGGRPLKD